MNKLFVSTLLLAVLAVAFSDGLRGDHSIHSQWASFKQQYNKVYGSLEEEAERFAVFKQNLIRIDQYNAKSRSATFKVNQFADLSKDEFRSKYLSKTPAVVDPSWPVAPLYSEQAIRDIPTEFDWREKGAVTEVKNQGQCGSCWSFSTTGNVEGQWFLAGNNLTSLSEQNLVDCDHECMEYENQKSCDAGCDGGLQPNAFTYIIKNGGIDTESSYPYQGTDGKCSFDKKHIGAKIDNFTMVSSDEDQMAAYLYEHGPLAIAADAVEWQFYFGGIFDFPCGSTLDHGILIVGYGNGTTLWGTHKNYWIVKNSWGGSWGEQGYLKIVRGEGKCGLNTFVSSAIITKKN